MAVDGTWNLVVNTPMGAQESTLVIASSGATLTGTQSAGSGEGKPIDEGTVDGDKLTGQVKLGMFGSAPFTGTRA